LGFTDISVSAKTADFIGLSRCWQNADNLSKKARTKSRQLSLQQRWQVRFHKQADKMSLNKKYRTDYLCGQLADFSVCRDL